MSLLDDFVDISGQERTRLLTYAGALERDLREDPVTGLCMPITTDRWTALEAAFTTLLRTTPPLQRHRVKALWQMATDQEVIEEADFLLSVAKEVVSLQQRLHHREQDEFTGEDGAA